MSTESGQDKPLSWAERHPLAEALFLLAITLPLAIWFRLPTLWLLAPLLVITVGRRTYQEYGLTWGNPGGLAFHLTVGAIVFIPYLVGHYFFGVYWLGARFVPKLPPHVATAVVDQLLIVGLPEEAFFRGYLQQQCDRAWGTPWRVAGADLGIGLVVTAAVFALCHIIYGGPGRLIVFFPALWYGWLRARTGSALVPAVYHAVSNLLMSFMLVSLET